MGTNQEHLPDFVVGIDFGQTYTGVVWTNLTNTNLTQSLQDWPGLPPNSVETKVPTKLAYPLDGGSEPRWGFLCDSDDESHEVAVVREHFKIYLDQDSLTAARTRGVRDIPETVDEAIKLTQDYLRQIYQHVKFSLESMTGSWKERKVEFVFSLPTTWSNLDTTNKFKEAIKKAGFTADNPEKHSAQLELTEAEAAAVYVATNPQVPLSKGAIILICDAGGGTTDLGLIEVTSPDHLAPLLKQVAAVRGVGIGSTMIDRGFELLVQRRLDSFPYSPHPLSLSIGIGPEYHHLPEDFAHKLARGSSFLSIKHNFGTRAATQMVYKLPLDRLGLGIPPDYEHRGLKIEGGKMLFAKEEIQQLFDAQIKGIIIQIGKQLDWMRNNRPNDGVNILVLSGGLGGSQYVKAKIQEHYSAYPHPNAQNMMILKSQEPRLAVVKGLVIDRRQKLISGTATLKSRIYGVLCRAPFDPKIHAPEDLYYDKFDKKQKWAIMQIDWLIKKGDTIDTDTSKERTFSRKLQTDDENKKWDTTIVISHEDRQNLPSSLRQRGAYKLCVIQSNLSSVSEKEFDLKNRKPWQGKKYYIATFAVRVIIAPADLKFELWFKGMRYNRDHDPVQVQWDEVGSAMKPPAEVVELEGDLGIEKGGRPRDDEWESLR
ncbi:hypothetical protein B7494_g1204 [Chlorociboria aeruginascens]|nr:hypothetical protein B7494_g1204 [Chlorociboria aeruginascens]